MKTGETEIKEKKKRVEENKKKNGSKKLERKRPQ